MDLPAYHHEAVQEVVDFLISGHLFRKPSNRDAIENVPALIISSLDNVDRFRDPDVPEAIIEYPLLWNDIIGDLDTAQLAMTRYWSRNQTVEGFSRVRTAWDLCWTSNPFGELRAELIMPEGLAASDLGCAINGIIGHRSVCGILPDHMHETFWQVIKWGGFPCGWSGGRNDGMIVVYIPPSLDRI